MTTADGRKVQVLDELSVFLENRPGQLRRVTDSIADAGVNLRALSLGESEHFGILRLLVDDLPTAEAVLHGLGIATRVTPVIGIDLPDEPGALASLLTLIGDEVNIEYSYAELSGPAVGALLIVKADPLDTALDRLRDAGL